MKKTNFVHRYTELSPETIKKRIDKCLTAREAVDVSTAAVKFSSNRKLGAAVLSVSLIPGADCGNCAACIRGCYDIKHDIIYPQTIQQRANNSAIYREDPEKFFREIARASAAVRFFRWHVGGDLKNAAYLQRVIDIARENSKTEYLIFTKMFGIVNSWIDKNGPLPENLHLIFSDWRGLDMNNPYKLPVSSPVWFDNSGNEIERGPHTTAAAQWCGGFCEDCAANGRGCWTVRQGETILFEAH